MAKPSPAKHSVECPHCGFKQMEYTAAKSTMCRQCGGHFVPSAPKVEIRLRSKEELATAQSSVSSSADTSLLQKFGGLLDRQRNSIVVVECFECHAKRETSGSATSSICPKCSAHIDLSDYKINTSFSRTIRTHGEVHLTAKGDLSSTSVTCRSALIEGKLRGNMHCSGPATINFSGKIPGQLTAGHVLIERKSDVQFFRRLIVKSIEIRGRVIGEIVADSVVVVHRNAVLDGNVTAKSITVEKGGVFTGQLIIGTSSLTQGELLPEEKPAAVPSQEAIPDGGLSSPLPAT